MIIKIMKGLLFGLITTCLVSACDMDSHKTDRPKNTSDSVAIAKTDSADIQETKDIKDAIDVVKK